MGLPRDMMEQLNSGEKKFWHCNHWFDDKWKKSMAGGGGNKKRYQEEWVVISAEPSDGQNIMDVPVLHSTDQADCILETPRISKQFDSLPGELMRSQDKAYFRERIEAPLPPTRPRPKSNFLHTR